VQEMLGRTDDAVLVTLADHSAGPGANIDLTPALMHCLRPLKWLNDEVINCYFQLLKERADRPAPTGQPPRMKMHFFSSFFTVKFGGGYSYKKVKRWSRRAKVKIVELDKVFVPCHIHGNHWCLAVINFIDRRFEYYDSLGGGPGHVLCCLRRYVVDEAAAYSEIAGYDLSEWTNYVPRDVPHQANFSDCGAFMCKYADYLSDCLDLAFTPEDMPLFRKRMLIQLLNRTL
jgi:sentrin-specific protease 1